MQRQRSFREGVWRQMSLQDGAAVDWLDAQGWEVLSIAPPFRLRADVIRTRHFALGRIWHSPARIRLRHENARKGNFVGLISVEGTAAVTCEEQLITLRPYEVLVREHDKTLTITTGEPTTRVVLSSSWTRLALADPTRARTREPAALTPNPGFVKALLGAATVALTEIEPTAPGFSGVQRSLESLLNAVVTATDPVQLWSGEPAHHDLFARAMHVMALFAADPKTTVTTVARELGISVGYLHHVCKAHGVTPARQLRAYRATLAKSLLGETQNEAPRLAQAAEASGFSSSRTMLRAIRDSPELP